MRAEQIQTEVLLVDAERPDSASIARAAAVIKRGGLVAFPTETVYGLGANALDAEAVERIFVAKGRPANNPLIVHVPDAEAAKQIVAEWPEAAAQLAARFWPGPLTLVLPRRESVPEIVTAGGPSVGVRVPAHPVAQALLRAANVPIAAPSANRSLRLSPTRAEHVLRGLDGRIEMLLDGGPTRGGLESTVLALTTAPPRLLRPGLIMPAEIEAVIGPIARPEAASPQVAPNVPLPSPGMLARHYAPRAPLELAPDSGANRVQELLERGEKVGWLHFQQPANANDTANLTRIVLPTDPTAFAAQLYAALHTLDESGVTRIVVGRLPETDDWLAIRDRLTRAATS